MGRVGSSGHTRDRLAFDKSRLLRQPALSFYIAGVSTPECRMEAIAPMLLHEFVE